MAAAIDAEKRHQSVPRGPSPFDGIRYEPLHGELDLFRFVESATDERVASIVEVAHNAAPDALADLRAALTQDDLYTLLAFARRRSLVALRDQSSTSVASGFEALALVDLERIDWRDGAVAAGLLAYAGRRTGADVHALVGKARRQAESAMADVIARHATRPEEGLAVGGYREIRTSGGVGLANDYGHAYAPNIDLISLAENVVALLEHDEYRVDNLVTGSDLPAVWLPAGDEAATAARDRLLGCLSVSARPKSNNRGMPDQMFSVWIAEAATTRDAQAIASAAVPKPGSETAIVAVESGPVCAVMVARSVVKGVPPHETMESIQRFLPALAELIAPA
jgi:hypothetical protein